MDEKYTYLVATRCFTYNHAPYILDTLQGFAMQQTTFPVVSVIVDDASTDGEATILHNWAKENLALEEEGFAYRRDMEYGELFFARHKDNSNAHFAILLLKENHTRSKRTAQRYSYTLPWIENATYFALCEGDDYWTDPLKLQKQVDYMQQHPQCGLCITDFRYQNGTNPHLSSAAFGERKELRPATLREHLFNASYIGPMTWLFRQDIYNQGMANSKPRSDGTFAIALDFFAISEVCYLDDVTAVYRAHEKSASNQSGHKARFNYCKGIFNTQIEYAQNYCNDDTTLTQLKTQGYTTYMLDAIEAEDTGFIQEALDFYHSVGLEMKWFVTKCEKYVNYRKKYKKIYTSKAYRIGKQLLKPYKLIKKS